MIEKDLFSPLPEDGLTPDEIKDLSANKIKSKVVSYALVTVRGAVSIALPDKIDSETYEALIALKKDPERKAYFDSILLRLSKNCLNVAISRLDTVIAHAEKLKKENKVINREGWLEAQETSLETDGIPVEQHNGNVVRIVNEVAERVNKALCTSYFTRDERLALPSASAAFTQPPTPATTQPQPCDCAANVL